MFGSIINALFHKEREDNLTLTKQKAKEIILHANEEALTVKQEAEKAARAAMQSGLEIEKRLSQKEQQLSDREKSYQSKQKNLEDKERSLSKLKSEIETEKETILQKLEKVASLTKEEARKQILGAWEDKLKGEIVRQIKEAEEEIKQGATEKAKEILIDSMRYGATDYVSEYTLAVIQLPSDDYKGRIIGKDGRNIRAFELATGVDVDLEEEGVIRISSFDAVRREIAKTSMEKLIKDGRIQPQRIEEIVKKAKSDMEQTIIKAGEDLTYKAGVFNLPKEIVKLLGYFKYRYSYGQNMILHTLEETKIGISLAHELHADVNTVKLGCYFMILARL